MVLLQLVVSIVVLRKWAVFSDLVSSSVELVYEEYE
jgi:hypothetical protein